MVIRRTTNDFFLGLSLTRLCGSIVVDGITKDSYVDMVNVEIGDIISSINGHSLGSAITREEIPYLLNLNEKYIEIIFLRRNDWLNPKYIISHPLCLKLNEMKIISNSHDDIARTSHFMCRIRIRVQQWYSGLISARAESAKYNLFSLGLQHKLIEGATPPVGVWMDTALIDQIDPSGAFGEGDRTLNTLRKRQCLYVQVTSDYLPSFENPVLDQYTTTTSNNNNINGNNNDRNNGHHHRRKSKHAIDSLYALSINDCCTKTVWRTSHTHLEFITFRDEISSLDDIQIDLSIFPTIDVNRIDSNEYYVERAYLLQSFMNHVLGHLATAKICKDTVTLLGIVETFLCSPPAPPLTPAENGLLESLIYSSLCLPELKKAITEFEVNTIHTLEIIRKSKNNRSRRRLMSSGSNSTSNFVDNLRSDSDTNNNNIKNTSNYKNKPKYQTKEELILEQRYKVSEYLDILASVFEETMMVDCKGITNRYRLGEMHKNYIQSQIDATDDVLKRFDAGSFDSSYLEKSFDSVLSKESNDDNDNEEDEQEKILLQLQLDSEDSEKLSKAVIRQVEFRVLLGLHGCLGGALDEVYAKQDALLHKAMDKLRNNKMSILEMLNEENKGRLSIASNDSDSCDMKDSDVEIQSQSNTKKDRLSTSSTSSSTSTTPPPPNNTTNFMSTIDWEPAILRFRWLSGSVLPFDILQTVSQTLELIPEIYLSAQLKVNQVEAVVNCSISNSGMVRDSSKGIGGLSPSSISVASKISTASPSPVSTALPNPNPNPSKVSTASPSPVSTALPSVEIESNSIKSTPDPTTSSTHMSNSNNSNSDSTRIRSHSNSVSRSRSSSRKRKDLLNLSADQLFPIFLHVVIQADVRKLYSTVEWMRITRPEGKTEYALATLDSAIQYIMSTL